MSKIEDGLKLDFSNVLIKPRPSTLSSRKDVRLERDFFIRDAPVTTVPIIAANMAGIGTISMAKALNPYGVSVAIHKHYSIEELTHYYKNDQNSYNNWYTMGISDAEFAKFLAFSIQFPIKYLCIDVANGYTQKFVDMVKEVRKLFPTLVIMAGNVVTAKQTKVLINAGADIVKVGIGPGAFCLTRKVAGVGYPQLSAIMECADAAKEAGGLICSDGGCQSSGDVAKALGVADFVMLGGMLSAHEESEFEIHHTFNDKDYYTCFGMSSETAQDLYNGGMSDYKASEGRTVKLEPRGPVEPTIKQILGGLRSAMTYVGAEQMVDFPSRVKYIRVTQQLNTIYE